MNCTGDDSRSPHEFMRGLWNRKSECCGPLISLRPDSPSVAQMATALDVFNASAALSQADQGDGSYVRCAAHWYDIAMVVGSAGEAYQDDKWKALRTALFIMVSHTAGWDHKEMFNRFVSHYRMKGGHEFSLGLT